MTQLVNEPWRVAVCRFCGTKSAWRHEYTGGQFWVVYKDGDNCKKCKAAHTPLTVDYTQERVV